MQSGLAPLVLTQGDPSGIGPELVLQAWLQTHDTPDAPAFVVVADGAHLAAMAERLGHHVPIVRCAPDEAAGRFAQALPVVETSHAVRGRPGHPEVADAAGTIAAIDMAVRLVQGGAARAIVTNPIAKHVLHQAGFAHPGHTEYLAELARPPGGAAPRAVMMLWSPELAVVPATIHEPLARVPGLLNEALIIETARIVDHDLRARFGVARPRLAFSGLNPHAGEAGDLGREEIEIIGPALERLRGEIDVVGPLPADTLFHAAARRSYDVCITMFHDQALIPIKTLAFESAVNVTLGLPFVRTSPDHGTAFDIAGRGLADPTSLLAAIQLADRLARA